MARQISAEFDAELPAFYLPQKLQDQGFRRDTHVQGWTKTQRHDEFSKGTHGREGG